MSTIDLVTLVLAMVQIFVVFPALREANGHSPLLVGYMLVSGITSFAAIDAVHWQVVDRSIYRIAVQAALLGTFFWATWRFWWRGGPL